MKILGVTGGIASGKSAAVKVLENLSASVIDADKIAHDLAQKGKALYNAYVEHFGEDILLSDGNLNRSEIFGRICADVKEREWIDNTAHPIIKDEVLDKIKRLEKSEKSCCVLDAPLLFEADWQNMVDAVWVIYVSKETQIKRLVKRDKIDIHTAQARLDAQMSLEDKKNLADVVIYNEGTIEELKKEVEKAWLEFWAQE